MLSLSMGSFQNASSMYARMNGAKLDCCKHRLNNFIKILYPTFIHRTYLNTAHYSVTSEISLTPNPVGLKVLTPVKRMLYPKLQENITPNFHPYHSEIFYIPNMYTINFLCTLELLAPLSEADTISDIPCAYCVLLFCITYLCSRLANVVCRLILHRSVYY